MQTGSLSATGRYPSTDPLEVFQGNTASGALRLVHDCLADLMVDVSPESSLFTGNLSDNLHAHLVFITKYRRGCITDRVASVLEESFRKVCNDFEVILEELGWEQDHAHLLISYPPKVSLSVLINSLKGVSSRRLRKHGFEEVQEALWGKAFWSPSYCVVSCGGAPLEKIKKYVEDQKGPLSSSA